MKPSPCRVIPAFTLAIGAHLAWPSPLQAQQRPAPADSASEQARRELDQAYRLYEQGDFDGACRLAESSARRAASPDALSNVGACRKRHGDWVGALQALEAASSEAQKERDPARRKGYVDKIDPLLRALILETPTLQISPLPTAGTRVEVDERPVPDLAHAIPLNPGEHRLMATEPGAASRMLSFSLAEGQRLVLALPASDAAPPPPRFGVLPWAFMGAGAALGLASIITSVAAKSHYGESDEFCNIGGDPDGCTQRGLEIRRSARSTAHWATFFGVVSGVSLATGISLYVVSRDTTPLTGAAVSWRGEF